MPQCKRTLTLSQDCAQTDKKLAFTSTSLFPQSNIACCTCQERLGPPTVTHNLLYLPSEARPSFPQSHSACCTCRERLGPPPVTHSLLYLPSEARPSFPESHTVCCTCQERLGPRCHSQTPSGAAADCAHGYFLAVPAKGETKNVTGLYRDQQETSCHSTSLTLLHRT